ncbi:MAG: NAD-dependent epimerase/dehydratase family protein [Bacteroidota bacterium]
MILVTGGTGLVGSHLLQELTSQGKKVRALHRKSSRTDFIRNVFEAYGKEPEKQLKMIEWFEGDVLDIFSLEDAMEDVSQVYHNAGVVSFSPGDFEIINSINVNGTANVVNAALQKGVKKICHLSSIAALGRAKKDGITDETTEWVSSRQNSNYAISKYNGEREVWRGSVEGLDAVILLPSVILGLSDITSGSMQLFNTILQGLPFYSPGSNGYVDARDVAKAQVFLMESDIVNEKFVISAENLGYKEVLGMIADGFGKRRPYIKVNKPLAEIARNFFKLKSLITGKPSLITKETTDTAMRKYTYSNNKFTGVSDMHFHNIHDTIDNLCRIYRENNYFRQKNT